MLSPIVPRLKPIMEFCVANKSSKNHLYNQSISPKFMLFVLLLIFIISMLDGCCNAETLRGTTISNWPYVNQKPNGQFEGFCIDLLNELAPLMGVAYTLSTVPDGQYGGWVSSNGTVNGMIGQVMRGEADFAIGDLTVLSNRARFVDFTISFMDYGLAALIRRDVLQRYGQQIRTFKDLAEQTTIKYGVKKHGANLPLFHDSPVVTKMYSFMDTHPSVFVEGEREGLQKVKSERYAFITESTFAEYVVQRDCDLVAIDDRRRNFQFEYAIAVPKGSPLKERFDRAIRKLKNEGRIRDLKNRYWLNPNRNCPGEPGFDQSKPVSTSELNFVEPDRNANRSPVHYNPNLNRDNVRGVVGVDFQGDRNTPHPDSGRLRFQKQQNNHNHHDNNRLRVGGRIEPHDRVDDEDIELIRPKPDMSTTRTRRPVINRRRDYSSSHGLCLHWLIIIATAFVQLIQL